jgi:hypothetical protein
MNVGVYFQPKVQSLNGQCKGAGQAIGPSGQRRQPCAMGHISGVCCPSSARRFSVECASRVAAGVEKARPPARGTAACRAPTAGQGAARILLALAVLAHWDLLDVMAQDTSTTTALLKPSSTRAVPTALAAIALLGLLTWQAPGQTPSARTAAGHNPQGRAWPSGSWDPGPYAVARPTAVGTSRELAFPQQAPAVASRAPPPARAPAAAAAGRRLFELLAEGDNTTTMTGGKSEASPSALVVHIYYIKSLYRVLFRKYERAPGHVS